MRPEIVLLALFLAVPATGDDVTTEFGGHTKLGAVVQSFPSDSVIRDVAGSDSLGTSLELRLNLSAHSHRWSLDTAWQLVGLHAKTLALTGPPNDERRLLDLTAIIDEGDEHAYLHRLDRLWVGYANEKAVMMMNVNSGPRRRQKPMRGWTISHQITAGGTETTVINAMK